MSRSGGTSGTTPGPHARSAAAYSERLSAPVSWWLLGLAFVASFWLAFTVALTATLTWLFTGVLAAATLALLLGYGRLRIEVTPTGLRVGRAFLEWSACGAVRALDAEESRRLRGVDADARAYLVLRPYLDRAVRVDVIDRADPTPYWLVATRRPGELADAVRVAVATAGSAS